MKLAFLLPLIVAGLLSGCMLDPVYLLSAAADASGPTDAERTAQFQADLKQIMVDNDRALACPELTRMWPEVKAIFQKKPDGQMYIDSREQVMAEKGCVVPATVAQSSDQAKPSNSTAASTPTAVAPVVAAPKTPSVTPVSSGALSTSIAEYTARETPERYRNRSCDYLHARLRETSPGLTSTDPEIRQWSQKANSVVSEVLVENNCGPASWVGGRVGAVITTIDPVKAARYKNPLQGVWVEAVQPGGGAEKAGLLRGDIIVAVNDVPVADASEFFVIVLKQPIGTTIRVKFWRVNRFVELPVVVAAPPV